MNELFNMSLGMYFLGVILMFGFYYFAGKKARRNVNDLADILCIVYEHKMLMILLSVTWNISTFILFLGMMLREIIYSFDE